MRTLAEAPLTERDLGAVKAAVEMLMERFPVERVILDKAKAFVGEMKNIPGNDPQ